MGHPFQRDHFCGQNQNSFAEENDVKFTAIKLNERGGEGTVKNILLRSSTIVQLRVIYR